MDEIWINRVLMIMFESYIVSKGSRPFSLMVTFFLILPMFSSLLALIPMTASSAPPPVGDWSIIGQENLSDADVVLNGNISVNFGGTLTLDHVTIRMNCTFNGQFNITVNTGGTLIIRNSTVTPTDFLQRYRYNFVVHVGSNAKIYDSKLEAIGEGNLTRPSTMGLYIETTKADIVNNLFTRRNILYLSTAIAIGPLASPHIESNTLSGLYSVGISALLGSKSLIKDNDITASGVGIACLSSSPRIVANDLSSNLIGVQLSSCDASLEWNGISNNIFAGINADSSDISMYMDQMINNGNDMVLNSTGLFANMISTTGSNSGIDVDNGGVRDIEFLNCSLQTGGSTMLTINNSVVNLMNTPVDRSDMDLLAPTAEIHVSWFLNVSVTFASGGMANGASVTILDKDNYTVATGTTGPQGTLDLTKVEEYHRVGDLYYERSPHTVSASKGSAEGSATVLLDASKGIEIELDDMLPIIEILEPADGYITNISDVVFKGIASDNHQITKVEYKVDALSWTDANGTGNWSFDVNLTDGDHLITVRAMDEGGNVGTDNIDLHVDSISPILTIDEPIDGALFNQSSISVRGRTEAGANLSLKGTNTTILVDPLGGFIFTYDLVEGGNTITLVARDRANNQASRSVSMTLDTIAPALVIRSPAPGLLTNNTSVMIEGTTDPGQNIIVAINGLPVTVDDAGAFSHTLVLSDGNYSFTIDAKDPAGNMVEAIRDLIVDTVPPAIEIVSPPDGLLTNQSLLDIIGRVETTNLTMGGLKAEPIPDPQEGWWSFDELIPLIEGPNSIVLKASDQAGNVNMMDLSVRLDVTPPEISIIKPLDGSKTKERVVTVQGTTEVGASIKVGDEQVQGSDGSFSVPIELIKGQNIIIIRSTDEAGNTAKVSLTVIREDMGHTSTELSSDYGILLLLVALGMIVVFLLFYNFAKTGGKDGIENENESQGDMGVPDLEENKLQELKEFGTDVSDEEMEMDPEMPLRGTLVLGGQNIEPANLRDGSDFEFVPRPRASTIEKAMHEGGSEARAKKAANKIVKKNGKKNAKNSGKKDGKKAANKIVKKNGKKNAKNSGKKDGKKAANKIVKKNRKKNVKNNGKKDGKKAANKIVKKNAKNNAKRTVKKNTEKH